MMSGEDQAGQAIGNLLAAMMAVADPGSRGLVLSVFERLNAQTLTPGPLRDQLDLAVRMQRGILKHLPS